MNIVFPASRFAPRCSKLIPCIPAPKTVNTALLFFPRKAKLAIAEPAAVRIAVKRVAEIIEFTIPVVSSNIRIVPGTVGKPISALAGRTLTTFIPT